jgi:hypothetical protein
MAPRRYRTTGPWFAIETPLLVILILIAIAIPLSFLA